MNIQPVGPDIRQSVFPGLCPGLADFAPIELLGLRFQNRPKDDEPPHYNCVRKPGRLWLLSSSMEESNSFVCGANDILACTIGINILINWKVLHPSSKTVLSDCINCS